MFQVEFQFMQHKAGTFIRFRSKKVSQNISIGMLKVRVPWFPTATHLKRLSTATDQTRQRRFDTQMR